MNCHPYYEDYEDSTVIIYPNCNITTCICQRCGQSISFGGKATREVIWHRSGTWQRSKTDVIKINDKIFDSISYDSTFFDLTLYTSYADTLAFPYDSIAEIADEEIQDYLIIGNGLLFKDYIQRKFIQISLSLWQEYSKECYADSTVEWYWDNPFMEGGWHTPCKKGELHWNTGQPCQCLITHKSPNNLSEFMTWLTNKYGRKEK